ncbi:MAG: GDP-mannose 4,6-dehydratase [Alphaproteobacteria bacterium]|nr:GDP-mannose 4,6-dehydratase [Alphaproteobacteria bacterium]
MKKIVITGGAGFIGSHVVDHFYEQYPESEIVVFDKMTYAADQRNLENCLSDPRVKLVVEDICHLERCVEILEGTDLLIHAAAESHVDNSFGNSMEFTRTNVVGTHALMEAAKRHAIPKIIHVSTDEVYGEVLEGAVDERSNLYPTNPYSASKAAAEMVISGYIRSFRLPVTVVRANNIYGIRQFPEKIIPKFLLMLLRDKKLTLHGDGQNRRHYLSALDFAAALDLISQKWKPFEIYNIGTTEEYTNRELSEMLCALFDKNPEEHITYVKDRPFNDGRYALKWDHITNLGWRPQRSLKEDLPTIKAWYEKNADRYNDI